MAELKQKRSSISLAIAAALLPFALTVGCASKDKMVKPDTVAPSVEQSIAADDNYKQEPTMSISAPTEIVTQDTQDLASESDAVVENGADVVAGAEALQTTELEASADDAQIVEASFSKLEPAKLDAPETLVIYFAVNKYDISDSDLEVLKNHVAFLQANPQLELNINGYSDSRGSAIYNFKLSKKRADQIHAILLTLGAPEAQLKVNSYGESFPVSNNNWDENRRVELQYLERDEPVMAQF